MRKFLMNKKVQLLLEVMVVLVVFLVIMPWMVNDFRERGLTEPICCECPKD